MPNYELLLHHDFSLDYALSVGDAFRYGGEVWRVESVEPGEGDHLRALLKPWPNQVPCPERIYGES
jgi:hypothetical protein